MVPVGSVGHVVACVNVYPPLFAAKKTIELSDFSEFSYDDAWASILERMNKKEKSYGEIKWGPPKFKEIRKGEQSIYYVEIKGTSNT